MSDQQVFKIAVIQARPVSISHEEMSKGGDVEHALWLLKEAKARGADIACFPELYPRTGEAELRRAASELGLWVVAGLEETMESSGYYNTATFISDEGEIVGRQRKVYPTEIELARGSLAGSDYSVIETRFGKFGAVICSDFAFVNHGIQSLCLQGVELVFNPSWWFALAQGFPAVVLGRHFEYGIPVIGVNMAKVSMSGSNSSNEGPLPAAGGYSTVAIPPRVESLEQLHEWFRTKSSGIDVVGDFCQTLSEEEAVMVVEVDLAAARRFPGYFYSLEARETHLANLVR
jgi:predicted amidohydrolase